MKGKFESLRVSVPNYYRFWQCIDDMHMDMVMVGDERLNESGIGIGDKNGSYRWIGLAIEMVAEEVNLTYSADSTFSYDHGLFSFEILAGLLPSKLKHLRLQTFSIVPLAKVISGYSPFSFGNYDTPFSCEILSGLLPSKLKTFSLAPTAPKVIVIDDQPQPQPQPLVVHSLASLELDDVTLDQTALETILSTCVNLRTLVLRECYFRRDLSIAGPSMMSNLQILTPLYLEELQVVSLANLTYFEYRLEERQRAYPKPEISFSKYLKLVSDLRLDEQGYNNEYNPAVYPKPKISFSNVPKLEEMRLDLDLQRYNHTVDDMFITAHAPQLKMITTTTILDPKSEPQIPLSLAILCQLEQLELILDINYCNLLNMIPVLLACPLLQKFHLKHRNHVDKHGHTMPFVACSSKQYPFPNLKQVQIRTFYANCGNPFVFYLLENAVALERIIIDTTSCCHELCKLKHRFHEVLNQQIGAKVASPIAKLVYRNHSRKK
ncbi:hypothetical protein COLO4_04588 [Corchorus olitorius]|uniref:At1g61320/AtMIF1 LRR domain-containing protein n=1 Tax=Corchorus olitorius TaxID=93759 RepID=A0A1R3KTC9_9ROSI|nr:hypothetical protein COLO4_04588 [Corchorus olitorius]